MYYILCLYSDAEKKLITGYGESNAFEFSIDTDGSFYVHKLEWLKDHERWLKEWDVVLTGPDEFSVGRMEERERSVFRISSWNRDYQVHAFRVTLNYITEGTEEYRCATTCEKDTDN